jgi:hypothetical protein
MGHRSCLARSMQGASWQPGASAGYNVRRLRPEK